MFKFMKKNENMEYALRLEDILTTENSSIICIFSEKGGITPLKLKIEEIFSNTNILRNVHPETIIALRKIYDMNQVTQRKLKLLSILNRNEFEVCFDGKFKTRISGKDFCADLSFASMMDIKDAVEIIYNTAFNEAFSAFVTLDKNDSSEAQEKEFPDETVKPILSIVK